MKRKHAWTYSCTTVFYNFDYEIYENPKVNQIQCVKYAKYSTKTVDTMAFYRIKIIIILKISLMQKTNL